MTSGITSRSVQHLLREAAPQVLAAITRKYGDFADAEDAVQEAMIAAASQWQDAGAPQNPSGWLFQAADRRMTDIVRSEAARRRREDVIAMDAGHVASAEPESDDTLALLFMCCHPAISTSSAIALALRAVAGLTTAEVANAFLVPEPTMAQRISRAKNSIRASGETMALPTGTVRSERVVAVVHVLYLMFNEGYAGSVGRELVRVDLANEAIRLTRKAHRALGDDPEIAGLLALMLLTDARRSARSGPSGELIPLNEQDRTLWNRDQIAEGSAIVRAIFAKGIIGPYGIQAAIAALHDEASSVDETDWREIHALYGLLMRMSDNPVVPLNRAVATAMTQGPETALAELDEIARDGKMGDHYRIDAVRAHVLEMAGDRDGAIRHYTRAAERTMSVPERNYLALKAARIAEGSV